MPEIRLFIATSLDGYIARENGSLDWLVNIPNPSQTDHGYNEMIANTDVIVMGRKTYDEILGFGIDWPYENCKTFVLTSKPDFVPSTPNSLVLDNIESGTIDFLKNQSRKSIWLAGGGSLVTQFLNLGAIDKMTISIVPHIFGKGIRLFPDKTAETQFETIKTELFDTGIVNLVYRRRF
jgi:dihydrofolate reductase